MSRSSLPFARVTLVIVAALACFRSPAGVRAASPVLWSGSSGGVSWRWSDGDLIARSGRPGAPLVSLKRRLFPDGVPDGFSHFTSTVRPLSVFGPVICYRRNDYWEGGAHPSGSIRYDAFNAARPGRPLLLTDLFPEPQVRHALWGDPVLRKLAVKAGVTQEPRSAAELVRKIQGQTFGGESGFKYSIPEDLLSEWSVHHLEGDRAAVRLCASWGSEIYRFQSTEIGLLLPIPPEQRRALLLAAEGREGFLAREAARRFKGRAATLVDGRSRNP